MKRCAITIVPGVAMLSLMCTLAAGPQPQPKYRFVVEVHTQGDTVMDPKTGKLLDQETANVKAYRSVSLKVESPQQVSKATFLAPPWKGDNGRLLSSGMTSARGEKRGRHYWGLGLKPKVLPDTAETNSFDFGAGTYVPGDSPTSGPKDPVGKYRLVSPAQAEVTLTNQQTYLSSPLILSVGGNDTTGYTVKWKAVPGAIGYSVSTYGGDTFWRNSDRDWQKVGAAQATEQGILLKDTTCLIPGGMYAEPFRVSIDAISPEVRVVGELEAFAYAHSQKTKEVKPSMGSLPRHAQLAPEDPVEEFRPTDPFRKAIFDGDLEAVKTMVATNPDGVNQKAEAVTPLELALDRKKRRVTRFLLDHGADVNLADGAGQTPLFFTCGYKDDADMAELLLKRGARIEIGNGSETPLHHAACFAELEIVKVLLKYKANPNSKDSQGYTPLDYTRMYNRETSPKVAALLKAHGARYSPPRPAPKPRPKPKAHRQLPAPTEESLWNVFDQAQSVELYSLDPVEMDYWTVLGKTTIAGQEKVELVSALKQGVKDSDGMEAACFNPRHAIVVRDSKQAYAMVICYECRQIYAQQIDPKESYDPTAATGPRSSCLQQPLPIRCSIPS